MRRRDHGRSLLTVFAVVLFLAAVVGIRWVKGYREANKSATAAVETVVTPAVTDEAEVNRENVSAGNAEAGGVYTFRNEELRSEHYEKHGIEMGFSSAQDYEKAASAVAEDPAAEHKIESEDGDDVYYLDETNELVIISTDGYIRTYFCPDEGRSYYERQ